MNITFVNAIRFWGGVMTWCVDMADCLQKQGHTTSLVARLAPAVEKARSLGIHAEEYSFGCDFNPAAIAYFLRFFLRHKTDVMVGNISKELRTAGVAARMLGIPIVQHIGAPKDVDDRRKTRLTQHLLKPHIVTCSDFVRNRLLERVPVYRQYDVRAIFPGTQPASVPPRSVGSPRTIIATSRLDVEKGYPDLLQAVAKLKKRGFDFRCVIVGTGRSAEDLRRQSAELGLDDVVEFTGFVTNVQEQLDRADIFVLPTYCEALGIALQEAMANGLVPVARNAGGPREIWPPDMQRQLVSTETPIEGFENALADLLQKPDEELLAMKQAAYGHAVRTFSLDKQAREFADWMQGFK
ncbi:glycosyltransferase [Salidesulfovibrio onnuriiensis]|uniref:glycosyltransferase n=1 Tax=Salidesulfovibrio onnuriiensis TaxID=2583823 RepID=UPI0011CA0474|nr:glycosyltransferase [Salidesulfovibrio onnuriiensis]